MNEKISEIPDDELVRIILEEERDDRLVAEELALRLMTPTFRYLFSLYQDEGVVADVVNDSFLVAWESLGKYDPEKGRLIAWFYGIARNKLKERLRKENRELSFSEIESYQEIGVAPVDISREVEEQQSFKESRDRAIKAMLEISPTDSLLFLIKDSFDLTFDQLADLYDRASGGQHVTPSALAKRYQRAKERLRKAIEEEQEIDD